MTVLAVADAELPVSDPPGGQRLAGFLPPLVGYAAVATILLLTGTPPIDLIAWTGYAAVWVMLPGTLVYRSLRSRPHTLVEDLAMGAAVGLVLELAAWAAFLALDAGSWLWCWPLAVLVPYAVLPRLRRHWSVRYPAFAPLGWAWTLTAVVVGFTGYLAASFLSTNPVLPTSEGQQQYIDLAFQLSIAGAATHQVPLDVPQVAGEPLHYHWFGFAQMAASSLISGVDLPTVFFRLAVPAWCALAAVLVAVVGWRVSGRAWVGVAASALMFTVGEFGFENGVRQLFGTQATFIVWGSPSMTYSWVLLLPLIAVAADRIGRTSDSAVPPLGRGAWVLAVLFLLASTGAKASSLPVLLAALACTAVLGLLTRRRLDLPVLALTGLALAAQLFATAVLFAFESHGVTVDPFYVVRVYVGPADGRTTGVHVLIWAAVLVAFLLNLQLRLAGVVALLRLRRFRLEAGQLFLLGGALAGPTLHLLLKHPGGSNQYFTRTGFAFGVLLSAWGYAELLDRAALTRRGKVLLGLAAAGLAVALTAAQFAWRVAPTVGPRFDRLLPLLRWAGALALLALLLGLLWWLLGRRFTALAGRGGVVLLTGILVAGAPGLVMDGAAARENPNGGAYGLVSMPASRVEAARWVRAHSEPDDVVATNAHCRQVLRSGACDARSFWLSAYAQRSVLVEGWGFAPRMVGEPAGVAAPFWDQDLLAANDAAFTAPTAAGLADLRDRRRVRWLVADRSTGRESPTLGELAELRFDNGRVAVYRLR
ncbi:hypothetical protein [Micromonospora mirobrigensis]|uniref:4-amino-4-deoxy-L-arabinose transferase n=1 Tax=Micromonospora mirobrigensis TaxID=262898 RepID=A0A1C5AGK3_9ACTN|nr:hypothetical protein [Micromonospora mirobrigensis]SCF44236.1 hypothetical protein GA0070564_11050 [Micromonospora mirobrigensis]